MVWTQWKADCSACAALCCIHLPFDAGPDFGHDKPAGQPCHHLKGQTCRLHDDLAGAGYAGCARYDCLGAGQRATALGAAPATFAALRRLHEDHLMLEAAARMPLPPEAEAGRLSLLAALDATAETTPARLEAYLEGPLPAEVRGFLRGLRTRLSPRR